MLEVFTNSVCFLIMVTNGLYVVQKIVSLPMKSNKTSYLYIFFLVILSIFLHPVQYTPIYTLTIFLLNTLIYKKIFNLTLEQATLACSIFMVTLIFADTIVTTPIRLLYTLEEIRTIPLVAILTNLAISIMCAVIIDTKYVISNIRKFYTNLESNKKLSNILFLILLTVSFCFIVLNYANSEIYNIEYISNVIIMCIFIIITYIYIDSRNSYKKLTDEYDTLFTYIQNFEDWIEKEQLNRHEYKNQLAVIRSITKDKKVKAKIDDILEDNINIEGDAVHKLKELPKGGLKGLVYYKVAIAQKNNLKIEVDVSLNHKTLLNNLTEIQIKTLCKLIGIYFDNAIEAAIETKQRSILLEIYELSNKVNIVLSNSYKKTKNFDKRNERGVTTKGEGHGNGLYFANNLILKNRWLESKQEEIDNYYIQTITIKN